MRIFYEEWRALEANSSVATDELQIINGGEEEIPIVAFMSIGFSHHSAILAGAKSLEERKYYIQLCYDQKLSVDEVQKKIADDAFHTQGEMPNNFIATIPEYKRAFRAIQMFKDEYLLDYINVEQLGERDEDIDERVIENEIVHNIKNFIMTFGHDFTFVGNQYHLEIYGEENFPDLLFFNRELNALVVVELKIGKFKPSYLGTLTSYLQILDAKVRKPHENPSIGIILCKSANKEFVELVIQGYKSPMGVATYTTSADMPEELRKALPDMEELKRILSKNDE